MTDAIVAPLAGAGIEISPSRASPRGLIVAPLAGAWIEIPRPASADRWRCRSLPSRECGLKCTVRGVPAAVSPPSRQALYAGTPIRAAFASDPLPTSHTGFRWGWWYPRNNCWCATFRVQGQRYFK